MLQNLIRKVLSKFGRSLSRHRGNSLVEAIVLQVSSFLGDLNNKSWNMEENGELRVLKSLKLFSPKVILDVGANKGEWSLLVSNLYPSSKIHSFEIVPSTFSKLVDQTALNANIIPNNLGLSDKTGKITINCSNDDSTVSTACKIEGMKFHNDFYDSQIECDVSTGSKYLTANNIADVDLLKIDVEGMDYKVLKGFGDRLSSVKLIQFEYGIFNISSHDLLIDFFILLESYGFIVGKVYPESVYFFDYHFEKEDFGGNNYIAVRNSELKLIASLIGNAKGKVFN